MTSTDLPLVVIDTRSVPTWDVVETACDVWGLTCWPTLEERGSVLVLLTDGPGRVWASDDRHLGGLATHTSRPCAPRVWAQNTPRHLAHELGHALGLDHADDPDNVMHLSPGRTVTADQIATVQQHAANLIACVGSDPIVK